MRRILVAGLGLIGSRHARAVRENGRAELVAVVDPDPALRAAPDAPGFADLADVDLPVDGAILATPSALHADHAETCLARFWPCLVEKPIAATLAEADRIVAASARAGLPVLTGHHRRHHASTQRLRALIAEGAIGRPVAASMLWAVRKPDDYFRTAWRQSRDGAPVRLNMVHDIDLLRFVLGEVAEVSAIGAAPVRGAGRVESGVIALRFASGAVASLTFSDTAPSPWGFEAGTGENPNIGETGEDFLWIAGTTGGVAFPSLTVWGGAADWSEAARADRRPAPRTDALAAQLDHFLDVLDGAPPLIDAADARETLRVTLMADAQAAGGAAP